MAIDWPSTSPDDPLHRAKHERALKRVRRFCCDLPSAAEKISRGHMPVFTARKNFAMIARTDGRPSIWLAAQPGAQELITEAEPERYYRPPYVGGRGWIGVWLDVDIDWPVVESLLREAHALAGGEARAATTQRKRRAT